MLSGKEEQGRIDWLNCPGPYVSYAYLDQCDWRVSRLLEIYPFFFDDDYWYWKPKSKCGAIVKRAPLWTYPTKSVPAEKAARKKAISQKGQTKLK